MSTSFYYGELPCAWIITKPNVEITIKANTPVIAVLPINLSELQNSEIKFYPMSEKTPNLTNMDEYSNTIYEINRTGKWTNFYRDAVDHKGNQLGEHQVKAIRLSVIDE